MAEIVIRGPRPYFAAKLKKAVAEDDVVVDGTDGLDAGTLQEVLQALATRIQALEDAP